MHGQCFTEEIGYEADLKDAGLPIRTLIASTRSDAIQSIVKRAGLDFFAAAPRVQLDQAIARIQQRAERFTPLLGEFLAHGLEPAGTNTLKHHE